MRDGPKDWENYTEHFYGGPLEIVSWPLVSTSAYVSGYTTSLEFFNKYEVGQPFMPYMLPNPMAFLVETILIEGISTALKDGCCRLVVMNKLMFDGVAAWMFSLRKRGYNLRPYPIMICPLATFRFSIDWGHARSLGRGLFNEYIDERQIRVVFHGQLARSVN